MIDGFSGSFAEARRKFVTAARDAGARVHSHGRDDLRGKEGEHLACDVGVLGADDAERAAIVITGTHGIEGYCGSAILHRWLALRASNPAIDSIKIVLVHALNCWGFSHKTRTTENNVDLNRNCLLGEGAYDRENPSYNRQAKASFGPNDNVRGTEMAATKDCFMARRREVAYLIWEREGRPNLDPREIWQRAERLIAVKERDVHDLGELSIPYNQEPRT